MYRRIYGTDHNRYSAMAIGNMGRAYLKGGDRNKAKECVKCAKSILGELLGTDDPDYEFFEQAEQKIRQEEWSYFRIVLNWKFGYNNKV